MDEIVGIYRVFGPTLSGSITAPLPSINAMS